MMMAMPAQGRVLIQNQIRVLQAMLPDTAEVPIQDQDLPAEAVDQIPVQVDLTTVLQEAEVVHVILEDQEVENQRQGAKVAVAPVVRAVVLHRAVVLVQLHHHIQVVQLAEANPIRFYYNLIHEKKKLNTFI